VDTGEYAILDTAFDTAETGEFAIRDTVEDMTPTAAARELMDRAARGEAVDHSALARELTRMFELAHRIGEDFERVVLLLPPGALVAIAAISTTIIDVLALPDGSSLVHTGFGMSDRHRIASLLGWDTPIACFKASQLEVASSATSFEDALYLLGDDPDWIA